MKKIKKRLRSVYKKSKYKLKKIKQEKLIRKFIKENTLMVTFVVTTVMISLLLRIVTLPNIWDALSVRPLIADTAVAVITGSFAYFLKPKNRIIYYMIFSIFFTAICLINSIYYGYYSSYASVSMLSLTQYVSEVGDAVGDIFKIRDILYLAAPLIVLGVYLRWVKPNLILDEKKKVRKRHALKSLAAGGIILLVYIVTMNSLDISRFVSQWNKEYVVQRFGIYIYQINDVVASITPKISALYGYDQAKLNFEEYFAEEKEKPSNEYTDIFKDKNVLMIHAESMQTNLIGQKFNDELVAPTLTRLSEEGMYFSNFYAQVSVGTSSDTEHTLNNSLMPTKSGTAFVSYPDRTYISTPNILADMGYYTFSMHANNADFWNRRTMHANLGYQRFYSKSDYEVEEENVIGMGLSDEEFFKQSIPYIEEINQAEEKWYGLMIQLTNHTPFADIDKYGEYPVDIKEEIVNPDGTTEIISYPYMEGTKLGNYMKSVHYADQQIDQLLSDMDAKGLLDDTVVIIYGDHDARLPSSDYERLYNYDKETDGILDENDPSYFDYDSYQYELGRKVPFIIWTKDMDGTDLNQEITNVMGMYDIQPTLGNMLGFYNEYALGNDIFTIKEDNIVVFPDGNWVTNDLYYNAQQEAYLPLTTNIIDNSIIEINNEYVSKLLEVSNDMIVYDLLNEDEDTKEEIIEGN